MKTEKSKNIKIVGMCWFCLNQYNSNICPFYKELVSLVGDPKNITFEENEALLKKLFPSEEVVIKIAEECQKKNLKIPETWDEFSKVL